MQVLGRDHANNVTGPVVIHFGQADKSGSDYGVWSFAGSHISFSQIQTAVNNFITGYNANPRHDKNIQILVAVSNYKGTSLANTTDYTNWGGAFKNGISGISISGYVTAIYGALNAEMDWNSNTNAVNEVLAGLLDIKSNLINKGEDVPANIEEKIALETAYTEELKKNLEKSKKDIEEMIAKRKIDPHYGELSVKPGNDPRPADSIGITDNPDFSKVMTVFGTRFGEDTISDMVITNMAGTAYNIILAGYDKDSSTGILLNITYKQDSFDIISDKLVFPQKGKIVFTNIDEKKNIVEFSYGENSNGYFDLIKNEAVFK